MKKLLLPSILFLFNFASVAQNNSGEITFYYEEFGASYSIDVMWRMVGSNDYPQVQFRVDRSSVELRSIQTSSGFYSFQEIDGMVFSETGDFLPDNVEGQAKLEIGPSGIWHAGNCRTSNDYRSGSFWATMDGWHTVRIEDSNLKNCLVGEPSGSWLEFGRVQKDIRGIEIVDIETGYNIVALKRLIASYEAEQGGNEKGRKVLNDYCNRNYDSESQILRALGEVNSALGENITTQWIRESLETCRTNLQSQLEDLRNGGDDYTYVSPHDRNVALGDAAYSQSNFQEAWNYYRTALTYEDNYYTRQKRDNAYQKWEEQRAIQGGAMLVEGISEMRREAPTGRLNGTFYSNFAYAATDYSRIPGLRFNDTYHGGTMAVSLDYNTWFNRTKSIGWHYGISAQLDVIPGVRGGPNDIDLQGMDKWEFSAYTGLNFFGYVEIDYIFRGLSMNGEIYGFDEDLDEYYTLDMGGGLSYDGGVRAAIYLLNQRDDFVRIVGHWINSSPNSPIGFLDFVDGGGVSTSSMGYKVEWGHSPLSFTFFHTVDSYYPGFNAVPMGVDIWGIGIGWGTGI